MATQSHHQGHSRPHDQKTQPNGTSTDPFHDSERPLAEVRKNVNDVLRILFQHRWMFFIPCCLAATIVFGLSLKYPRAYQAVAQFERKDDPIMVNLSPSEATGSFGFLRSTMSTDLTSPEVMNDVVKNLGMDAKLPRNADGSLTRKGAKQRDAIGRSLASNVNVVMKMPSRHIDRVRIEYVGPDPILGARLVEEIKKVYMAKSTAWFGAFLNTQHDYFAKQADAAYETLNKGKTELTNLALKYPLIDPNNPGVVTVLLSQAEDENRRLLAELRDHQAALDAKRELLALHEREMAKEAATTPSTAADMPSNSDDNQSGPTKSMYELQLSQQIARLNEQINSLKLANGMTNEHPKVKDLIIKRRIYEGQLERERTASAEGSATTAASDPTFVPMPSPVLAPPIQESITDIVARVRFRLEIGSLEQRIADAQAAVNKNSKRLETLAYTKDHLQEYQERVASIRDEMSQATSRLNENRGSLRRLEPALISFEQGNLLRFSSSAPASASTKPVSPKSKAIFLLAALAAIGFGSLFVILAELFDHVYRSAHHVTRSLGLPILETIDEIVTTVDRRKIFVKRAVVFPLLVLLVLGITGGTGGLAYISIEQPHMYDRVRQLPQKAMHIFAGIEAPEAEAAATPLPPREVSFGTTPLNNTLIEE